MRGKDTGTEKYNWMEYLHDLEESGYHKGLDEAFLTRNYKQMRTLSLDFYPQRTVSQQKKF